MQNLSSGARAALVVSHPSHELRVHGWLQAARPRVFVLTDGSGRTGQARLPSTTNVISQAGAEPGSIYGWISDLKLYSAMLNQDFPLFIDLVEKIAGALLDYKAEYVIGDAAEGYSSAHDLCRLLIDAAVELLDKKYHYPISSFDFLVVGPPENYDPATKDQAIWIHLDEAMFVRKVSAARGYNPKLAADIEAALKGEPFQGIRRFSEPQIAEQVDIKTVGLVLAELRSKPDLDAKIKDILGGFDLDAFRVECLRPVNSRASVECTDKIVPFYELYGEKLVAAGRYDRVIRYREHILPIAEALRHYVEKSTLERN